MQALIGLAFQNQQQQQYDQQRLESAKHEAKIAQLLAQVQESRQSNDKSMGQWVGQPEEEQPHSLPDVLNNTQPPQDETMVPFMAGAGVAGMGTTMSPYLINKTSGNVSRGIKAVFQPDVVALNRGQKYMQKGAQKAISGAESLAGRAAGKRGASAAKLLSKGAKYLPKVASFLPKIAGWPALVAGLADASLQMTDENGQVYQTTADDFRTNLSTSLMDILGETGMGAGASGVLAGLVSGGADVALAPMGLAEKMYQQTFNGDQYEWDLANPLTGEL